MPEIKPDSVAARAQHSQDGTCFRKDATQILEPDDLSEGGGDLRIVDADGNPLSADGSRYFEVKGPPVATEWAPYIGTATQGVDGPTKQVTSPYPFSRQSWLGNQPPIQGDLPPGILSAAKIQKPLAPLMVAEPVGIEGFAAAPDTAPFFVFYCWVKNGRLSLPSPYTLVPAVELGQSIRALLPTQIPEGVDAIALGLTEPGTSTPTIPGPGKIQRVIDISTYNPGIYDLTGPYRHDQSVPFRNHTKLLAPRSYPGLRFSRSGGICRPGSFQAKATWSDSAGETLAGGTSPGIFIERIASIVDDQGNWVGEQGRLFVTRPDNPPPDATGWRPYIYVEGAWHVLYDSFHGLGNEKPYPIGVTTLEFGGWESTTDLVVNNINYTASEKRFLVEHALPTENTTGIEDPTDPLEQPVVFGVMRFPSGTYYGGVTEFANGGESLLSPLASVTINANEIPRIIHQDRVNLIPNVDNIEIGANGLPLDQTIDQTGLLTPYVEASDPGLVLSTNGAQTGTIGSRATRWVAVAKSTTIGYRIKLTARQPRTGVFQGSAQAVFEQQNSAGTVTQTVLGTISAPGDLFLNSTITTASTTTSARLVMRFSGTTQNLEMLINTTQLYSVRHKGRRKRKRKLLRDNYTWFIPDSTTSGGGGGGGDDTDSSVDPPGTEIGIVLPPDIPPTYEPIAGGSPTLVTWAAPDRPSSSGVLLEAKHDFETAIPARWKQHVNGATVTLTRYATSPLAGSYSLRSYKAS